MFKGGLKFPTGNFTDNCFVTDVTPCPAATVKLTIKINIQFKFLILRLI